MSSTKTTSSPLSFPSPHPPLSPFSNNEFNNSSSSAGGAGGGGANDSYFHRTSNFYSSSPNSRFIPPLSSSPPSKLSSNVNKTSSSSSSSGVNRDRPKQISLAPLILNSPPPPSLNNNSSNSSSSSSMTTPRLNSSSNSNRNTPRSPIPSSPSMSISSGRRYSTLSVPEYTTTTSNNTPTGCSEKRPVSPSVQNHHKNHHVSPRNLLNEFSAHSSRESNTNGTSNIASILFQQHQNNKEDVGDDDNVSISIDSSTGTNSNTTSTQFALMRSKSSLASITPSIGSSSSSNNNNEDILSIGKLVSSHHIGIPQLKLSIPNINDSNSNTISYHHGSLSTRRRGSVSGSTSSRDSSTHHSWGNEDLYSMTSSSTLKRPRSSSVTRSTTTPSSPTSPSQQPMITKDDGTLSLLDSMNSSSSNSPSIKQMRSKTPLLRPSRFSLDVSNSTSSTLSAMNNNNSSQDSLLNRSEVMSSSNNSNTSFTSPRSPMKSPKSLRPLSASQFNHHHHHHHHTRLNGLSSPNSKLNSLSLLTPDHHNHHSMYSTTNMAPTSLNYFNNTTKSSSSSSNSSIGRINLNTTTEPSLSPSPPPTSNLLAPPTSGRIRSSSTSNLNLNSLRTNHTLNNNNNNSNSSTTITTSSSNSTTITSNTNNNTSSKSISKRKKVNKGIRGLTNLGNTCFMNACIQCLSNIRDLRDYFLEHRHEKDLNTKNTMQGNLAKDFHELICQLWKPVSKTSIESIFRTSSVSPTQFKKTISTWAPQFSGCNQQDSQEFLRFLLDGLHEDLNRVRVKPMYEEMINYEHEMEYDKANRWWKNYIDRNNSFITDLFCGQLKSSVTCLSCKYVSSTFDPFMDISVPIPISPYSSNNNNNRSSINNTTTSLYRCIDTFVENELLDDVYCSKCGKLRRVEKGISFFRLPRVLVIHLKRFSQSNDKLLDEISADDVIDLRPYVDLQSQKHLIQNDGLVYTFTLSGVIKHMGGVKGGHYTADVKHADSGEWYSFNDTSVSRMKKRTCSSLDYILFYERNIQDTNNTNNNGHGSGGSSSSSSSKNNNNHTTEQQHFLNLYPS